MYACYKQLERDIIGTKMDLKRAREKRAMLIDLLGPRDVKALAYDHIVTNKAPVASNKDTYIIYYYNELIYISDYINILKGYLDKLLSIKKEFTRLVEEYLKNFKDLETEVFYWHHMKGLNLNEVSSKVHYSYGHVRRINMEIVRKIKNNVTEMQQTNKKYVV
jgi:DNA-directed RNA polymerase specialized sigma24 family protein